MGQVRGRTRLLVVVAYVVLHPLLRSVELQYVVDGFPAVGLSVGLLVAMLLSLGPAGVVLAVAVRCGSLALLGEGGDALLAELVATLGFAPITLWMEFMSVRRGRSRTDLVVLEFVVLAGVLAPGFSTWSRCLVMGTQWQATDALGPALGVLLLAPGLRVMLFGVPDLRPRWNARGVLSVLCGLLVVVGVTALVASSSQLGSVPVLALILVTAGSRLGFDPMTSLVAMGTLLVFGGLLLVAPDAAEIANADRFGVLAVAAAGLFAAVETDRRAEAADELDVLFRSGAQPAAVVTLPGLDLVRPNPLLVDVLGLQPGSAWPRGAFVRTLAAGPEGIGVLADLVSGARDEVDHDVWFRDHAGQWRYGQLSAKRLGRAGTHADHALVQITDLTEVHERNVALERANTALNRLSGRIAHDLRQPLSAIVGYASTIDEHVERLPPDLLRDMSGRLSAAATRAAERLDALAEAARHAGDGPQPIDLQTTLDRVGETLALDVDGSFARLQRRLEVDEVVGDPGAVSTILLNLVGNALKYARPGSSPAIRVTSRSVPDGWRITVEDEGLGIPVGELDRVFVRGSRLDVVDVPGSGTGLTDSRDLAEAGGGWLEALPSPDGARFELMLPHPDPSERSTPDEPPLRVLHIDGAGGERRRLRSMLDLDDGVEHVGAVSELRDVVPAVRATRPDVVLVGTGAAGADLRPAVADARAEHPYLRVVHVADGDLGSVLEDLARLTPAAPAARPPVHEPR